MANRNPRQLPEGLRDMPIGVLAIRVELFAQAICEGKNQSQAYLAANPESAKLAKKQLAQRATQFARTPEVMRRVEQIRYEMLQRHRTTADSLLAKHVEIINADVADLFDDDWKARSPQEIRPSIRTALEKVKITERTSYDAEGNATVTRNVEFGVASKQRSIEAAAMMLGVDKPKAEEADKFGLDDLANALAKGLERAHQNIQRRKADQLPQQ